MLKALFLAIIISSTAAADNPSIFLVGDTANTYTGTAFVLQTKKGAITVTNAHVCGKESVLAAKLQDRMRILVVRAVYKNHDLCILAPPYGIPALKLGSEYKQGQLAFVEGFPLGKHSITFGLIGPYARSGSIGAVIVEYLGHVDHGNSGSPFLNSMGEVIGVVALLTDEGRVGGIVPLEFLKDFVDNNPNIY